MPDAARRRHLPSGAGGDAKAWSCPSSAWNSESPLPAAHPMSQIATLHGCCSVVHPNIQECRHCVIRCVAGLKTLKTNRHLCQCSAYREYVYVCERIPRLPPFTSERHDGLRIRLACHKFLCSVSQCTCKVPYQLCFRHEWDSGCHCGRSRLVCRSTPSP
jgi:hypothetical protein